MVTEFVRTMYQDKKGNYWFGTNGNGIFKYKNDKFIHLTTNNGLTDNNTADILEDKCRWP
jgi:ligand-binding sensor domain-containing protein